MSQVCIFLLPSTPGGSRRIGGLQKFSSESWSLSRFWAPFTSQIHLGPLWWPRRAWQTLARGHLVGEIASTASQEPQRYPIRHTQRSLNSLSCAMRTPGRRDETRRLVWIWAFDLFSEEYYTKGRRLQTRTLSYWKCWLRGRLNFWSIWNLAGSASLLSYCKWW